jgi:hypothetical protein
MTGISMIRARSLVPQPSEDVDELAAMHTAEEAGEGIGAGSLGATTAAWAPGSDPASEAG